MSGLSKDFSDVMLNRMSMNCSDDERNSSAERVQESGPKLKSNLQKKNGKRFAKGTALGFGAMVNTASQEFLNGANDGAAGAVTESGLARAMTGGALENIKEEVYLSKGGVVDTRNPHLQDH